MTLVLAVLVGGAIGAPLRFLIDRAATSRAAGVGVLPEVPWGLVVVNVLGSAIAGVLLVTTTGELRVLLITGMCGALTTFSGFAWESHRLWSVRRPAFWVTITVIPVACLAAFLIAWLLTRTLIGAA